VWEILEHLTFKLLSFAAGTSVKCRKATVCVLTLANS
jgi:hypothetical protein